MMDIDLVERESTLLTRLDELVNVQENAVAKNENIERLNSVLAGTKEQLLKAQKRIQMIMNERHVN